MLRCGHPPLAHRGRCGGADASPCRNGAEWFYISFGERFNADALRAVPLDRLLAETDESTMPIGQIISQLATALQMPSERLESIVAANLARALNFCD